MMRFTVALLFSAALAAPALADKCQDDVKQIEAAIASKQVSGDERAQHLQQSLHRPCLGRRDARKAPTTHPGNLPGQIVGAELRGGGP